jgi:hypothetical protein
MPITHEIRSKDWKTVREVNLTPRRAIRLNCLECVGHSYKEAAECVSHLCPLWPFRPGQRIAVPKKGHFNAQKQFQKKSQGQGTG